MADNFGYAGKVLRVDLSSGKISDISTDKYAGEYIGGRGMAARIYWDEVSPEIDAFHPENRLMFITGPLAGFSGLSGSRWQICGKSPSTEPHHFFYSNVGGGWGAHLKLAGYDGLVVQGASEKPVYLSIDGNKVELKDAAALWRKSPVEVEATLRGELGASVRIATTGPAGDNLVPAAVIFADQDAAGCGFGAVMGAKKLKAIAVHGDGQRPSVADPDRFQSVLKHIQELVPDGALVYHRWMGIAPLPPNMKRQFCYGCRTGCNRAVYEAADGDKGKHMCSAAAYYRQYAMDYYKERNDVPFKANRICNLYGIDTGFIGEAIKWLSLGYQAGILSEQNTGIPVTKIGSQEFIESLVKNISLRQGFGDVMAKGLHQAAAAIGGNAKSKLEGFATLATRTTSGDERLYITPALLAAMECRYPIQQTHEIAYTTAKWRRWVDKAEGAFLSDEVFRAIAKRFWGSEVGGDFSTYEGKALAAKKIQERQLVKESLVLCDRIWPITYSEYAKGYVGDPTLEGQLYSAVTGNELDEDGMYQAGERIFNLQRAILVREGHKPREADYPADYHFTAPMETALMNPQCFVPGKEGQPVSRKGAVLSREEYGKTLDDYYQLRGWDVATGLQTGTKLKKLGLKDVAEELKKRGLSK